MTKKISDGWDKWIGVFYKFRGSLHLVLGSVDKKYKKIVALALAVSKWHPSTLERGYGPCGLCKLYREIPRFDGCQACPLFKKTRLTCDDSGSIHYKWCGEYKTEKEVKYANQMHKTLLSLYKEELKKFPELIGR